MKVTSWPPPIGTGAVLFWAGKHYIAIFRGVSSKTGMWHFSQAEDSFFVVPGSRVIVEYLTPERLKCVAKTTETDSQLGP